MSAIESGSQEVDASKLIEKSIAKEKNRELSDRITYHIYSAAME
jgi:hypothetical protein